MKLWMREGNVGSLFNIWAMGITGLTGVRSLWLFEVASSDGVVNAGGRWVNTVTRRACNYRRMKSPEMCVMQHSCCSCPSMRHIASAADHCVCVFDWWDLHRGLLEQRIVAANDGGCMKNVYLLFEALCRRRPTDVRSMIIRSLRKFYTFRQRWSKIDHVKVRYQQIVIRSTISAGTKMFVGFIMCTFHFIHFNMRLSCWLHALCVLHVGLSSSVRLSRKQNIDVNISQGRSNGVPIFSSNIKGRGHRTSKNLKKITRTVSSGRLYLI